MTTATPADKLQQLPEHYSDGRRWSRISNAWILLESWNDREEIAYLTAHASALLSRAELAEQMVKELREAALRSELAGKDAERLDAQISAYSIPISGKRFDNEITVQQSRQIEGPPLWAVRLNGECLNKSGEWEWEPMPSSRDDEFLARCRFATHTEAIRAAIESTKDPK